MGQHSPCGVTAQVQQAESRLEEQEWRGRFLLLACLDFIPRAVGPREAQPLLSFAKLLRIWGPGLEPLGDWCPGERCWWINQLGAWAQGEWA
jgi:hypothetical protein